MKNLRLWAFGTAILILFSISAMSQTAGTSPPSKIGWIDTAMFSDEKAGVTKFVGALKTLDAEFKPRVAELEGLQGRIKVIADELQKPANPAVPVKPETIQAKRDDGERLQREFDFKKKEFEAAYSKRRNEVISPLTADILKVMQDFARQKGYGVIFDIGALAQTNALLVLDPAVDITKEFVAFYNARPPAAAVAVSK